MLISVIVFSSQSVAQSLSEQQLRHKIAQFQVLKNDILSFRDVSDFNDRLQAYDDRDQAIIIHLWLDTLSRQPQLNEALRQWIETQTANQQRVMATLLDHPEHALPLINIQDQAKATLKLLTISQLQGDFSTLWQQGQVVWADWLNNKSLHYAAFIQWLKTQSSQTNEQVIQQLEGDHAWSLLPDNQVYFILLQSNPSAQLAVQLLSQSTDEFTYQFLHHMPAFMDEFDGLSALEVALQKSELNSQSLFVLAAHYTNNPKAQAMIEKAFDSPVQKWHALAVIDKINDRHFRAKLHQRFETQQTAFAKTAMQVLAKGDAQ
ncbi:hypothetical protein [Aliiglaciecola litoralis]